MEGVPQAIIVPVDLCDKENLVQRLSNLKHFWEASKPLWLGVAAFVVLGALLAGITILMSYIEWT